MKNVSNYFLLMGVASVSMGFGLKSDSQKVREEFISNPGFSHYGKCVLVKIHNPNASKVDYSLPAGHQLLASDSDYQNLVVTENVFVTLLPGERKSIPIYAMCTEPHDAAPSSKQISYTSIRKENKKLVELSQLIAQEKLYTSEGQQAVWCLVDNQSLENIAGFDTSAVRKLQRKVATLTNQKMPPPPAKSDYKRNYYASHTTMKVKVGGSYSFNFPRTKSVHIAMFNSQNVLVRELYKNEQEAPGRKTINYAFDATVYTDPVYFMRMFVDGEKRMETKMNMN